MEGLGLERLTDGRITIDGVIEHGAQQDVDDMQSTLPIQVDTGNAASTEATGTG